LHLITTYRTDMKNKTVAAILAFFFGIFGVHRFYLGRWWQGVMMVFLFFVSLMITIEENAPVIMIPAIFGFIDSVLFAVMPHEDFDEKYNQKRRRNRRRRYQEENYAEQEEFEMSETARPSEQRNTTEKPRNAKAELFKKVGIEKFRRYDFEGAIESFMQSLEENISSPSTHFNLACCYSMIENAPKSLLHLQKAVENGFTDLPRIHSHQALGYVRKQAEFQLFVENGYRIVPALPQPGPNLLDQQPSSTPNDSSADVLDEILHLGDLRDKGLISEEEFLQQKKKLLA
jgi:tetratricopeptide (TPR) repeat protein